MEIDYTRISTEPTQFTNNLQNFVAQNGRGLNVTAPLKELAYRTIVNLGTEAQQAQAVNTITINQDKTLKGDNTDGIGFIRDLTWRHRIKLKNRKVLILGAGGAARGILSEIILQNPSQVAIMNRTIQKAKDLAIKYGIEYRVYNSSKLHNFDLLINATSISLSSKIIVQSSLVYDLNYQFNYDANNVITGLGMLIEQAAESFYIWHNLQPNTELVYNTLIESAAINTLP